jgi:hypothetical protein
MRNDERNEYVFWARHHEQPVGGTTVGRRKRKRRK